MKRILSLSVLTAFLISLSVNVFSAEITLSPSINARSIVEYIGFQERVTRENSAFFLFSSAAVSGVSGLSIMFFGYPDVNAALQSPVVWSFYSMAAAFGLTGVFQLSLKTRMEMMVEDYQRAVGLNPDVSDSQKEVYARRVLKNLAEEEKIYKIFSGISVCVTGVGLILGVTDLYWGGYSAPEVQYYRSSMLMPGIATLTSGILYLLFYKGSFERTWDDFSMSHPEPAVSFDYLPASGGGTMALNIRY